jgi:uncharacterized protein
VIPKQTLRLAAVLTLVAVTLPGLAAAQDGVSDRRSISVSGQGEASAAPDMATINAGVQTLAPTVEQATRENQAAVAKVLQALETHGIAAKDMQTADYGIWPEQRYDARGNGEATITGYRVNNSVKVTVRDIARVGEVLGAVTTAGANAVNGVSFGLADDSALEVRARALAMADARARAEDLAKLAGVELGEVLTLSTSTGSGYPRPMVSMRMEAADAAPPPGIAAGELDVSVQVQVTYAIR